MSFSGSDCSESSDCSENETLPVDEFGRPVTRPNFRSVGPSSVLARAKEFLPLFRNATVQLIEPDVIAKNSDIRLPTRPELEGRSDESDSPSSFGIEIDVGLGVFDVNGDIEHSELSRAGIPIVEIQTESQSETEHTSGLIQEIESIR